MSCVTGSAARASAEDDSSGHFTCTKCTSAACAMPASAIASRTACAVASICARRPISSGWKSRVRAWPMTSLGPRPVAGAAAHRVNTVKCGASTPSVPPDMTSATRCAASSGLMPSCAASQAHQALLAYSRVKSLTQPLPSVLPITATMSSGRSTLASTRACTPDRSPGPLQATR